MENIHTSLIAALALGERSNYHFLDSFHFISNWFPSFPLNQNQRKREHREVMGGIWAEGTGTEGKHWEESKQKVRALKVWRTYTHQSSSQSPREDHFTFHPHLKSRMKYKRGRQKGTQHNTGKEMEAIGRAYTHVSTRVCASVFVHSYDKSEPSWINLSNQKVKSTLRWFERKRGGKHKKQHAHRYIWSVITPTEACFS